MVIILIIIKDVFLNIILILFPILLYFIFSCYLNLKKKEENDILFSLTMISSLYLCLKFGNIENNSKILLFCNIPIIIAYLKKKTYLGIILSIFVVLYCYLKFDFNIYILILKYICYFIAYSIYIKTKISDNHFIKIIAVLQGFFISFEYFFSTNNDVIAIFELLIIVLIFYLIPFAILFLFSFMDTVTSMYYSAKEIEREKQIKTSLFKITHEIKNPIAVCKGYLDMLDTNNKVKMDKYIPIVKQEIEHCLNIMNDFMEFSKITIKEEVIDINLLLDDVFDGFKVFINSENINLNYIESDEEVYLLGDYNRLKQVLLNVLKNSIESINGKGNIKIESYKKERYYYIEITDDGCGMDKETMMKIKDMFFTTKEKGSGLGVSLSNEIIKAHNGTLNYKSKLGEGTKVIIRLPLKN